VARNGLDALKAAGEETLDLVRRTRRCLEAAALIRRSEGKKKRRLPIIALTARDEWGRGALLEAGMDGYLSKPIRSEQL
jgi:CheY-like chemotaxis protein